MGKSIEQFNSTKKSRFSETDKHVLTTAVVVSATFITMWTPYTIMVIYEAISGKPAPAIVDAVAANLALLNSALNPVQLLILDKRLQGVFKAFIQ
jgi:hypothetical protein